jgi:hypothetical protein
MRPDSLLTTTVIALMSCVAAWLLPVAVAAAPAWPVPSDVTSVPVAFDVENVNGSLLPCAADGKRYVLRGRLVGPRTQLRRARLGVMTVYVHDFTTGGWFWRFPDRRHNHVRTLARAGHVSLVLDRLGYDDRHDVEGTATCLGAQADMLHQVVQRLRAGDYRSASARPRARRVVVAGHAVGGAIAELEAASFDDVDGLVLMSWSDSGPSPRAVQEAAVQTQVCLAGGDPRAERPGYAYFGQSRRVFRNLLFHSATPEVQRRAARLRNADPCGDALTLGPLVAENNVSSRSVDVPVLLLFGAEDVLNRPEAANLQQQGYRPGSDVTTHVLPGTGSALPLESTAPHTRRLVASWTCQRFRC